MLLPSIVSSLDTKRPARGAHWLLLVVSSALFGGCGGGGGDPAPTCATGTWDHDGVRSTDCVAHTSCTAGEYVVTAGTATADQVCAACASGTYSTVSNAASCTAHTACAAGSYVTSSGTATADRTCAGCASGTFSTTSNASQCVTWTTCVAGRFVATAGTVTSDVACQDCATGTYTSGPNQSACVPVGSCAPGTEETAAATSTMPPTCRTCTAGEYCAGGTAAAVACNAGASGTWDHDAAPSTACVPWTTCVAGTYVSTAGDATTDRSCSACSAGTFTASDDSAACVNYTDCAAGRYVVTEGSSSSDRVCQDCAAGSYTVSTNQTTCTAWSACSPGYEEDAMGTSTSDRTCVPLWGDQFGSSLFDDAVGVAYDAGGNFVVAGSVFGALPGQTPAGIYDFYVRRYGADGEVVWTVQSGTSASDNVTALAVDVGGTVVVAGNTGGTLGTSSQGGTDAFVRMVDSTGAPVWTQQFGTASFDVAYSVAMDSSGNVVVVGYTDGVLPGQANSGGFDAYVRKFDADGNELWTRQFGTVASDRAYEVATDAAGNVYVAGETAGTLPGQTSLGGVDAYVRKYDPSGTEVWTHHLGTAVDDGTFALAVSATGEAYVAGFTNGAVTGQTNLGGSDVFVVALDAAGVERWTRQLGSDGNDYANSLVFSPAGELRVVGYTDGTLPGEVSYGGTDAFAYGLSTAGATLWSWQFGTDGTDYGDGIAENALGDILVAGRTEGTFPGQTNFGARDAFVTLIQP